MPKFKIRLLVPVKLTASLEFEMEAEDQDAAFEGAFDEWKKHDTEYQEKLKAYHRSHSLGYPESTMYWSVDSDDIEGNMDERDIEVDSATEVK